MRRKAKFLALMLSLTCAISLFSACGNTTESADSTSSGGSATESEETTVGISKDKLQAETFYVQHNDSFIPLAFAQASFQKGNISNSASVKRTMMFKDDAEYDSIPTLYKGDKLVFYSKEMLPDTFTFERFDTLGFSVGLCGLTVTGTGRYQMETGEGSTNVYANSETNGIISLDVDRVILDSIGGTLIRSIGTSEDGTSYISDWGTVLGLKKDQLYEAKIYAGTIENDFRLTANIAMFGSSDAYASNSYSYEDETLAVLTIPEWFNTGYYLVNGAGLFRYVKEGQITASTNFNIKNEAPATEDNISSINTETGEINGRMKTTDETGDTAEQIINVTATGEISLYCAFTTDGSIPDSNVWPSAWITSPSGETYNFENSDGDLTVTFTATEIGQYVVHYTDLEGRTPILKAY